MSELHKRSVRPSKLDGVGLEVNESAQCRVREGGRPTLAAAAVAMDRRGGEVSATGGGGEQGRTRRKEEEEVEIG